MKEKFIKSRVEKRIKDLGWDRSMFYIMTRIGELPNNIQSTYSNEEWDERISYAAYLLDCSKDYLTNSKYTDIGYPVVKNAITTEEMFDCDEYIKTIRQYFNHVTYDNILLVGEESGIPMPVYIDIIFGKIFINRSTANKLTGYLIEKLNIDRHLFANVMTNKCTFYKVVDLIDTITDLKTLDNVIDKCNKLKEKINESKNEIQN